MKYNKDVKIKEGHKMTKKELRKRMFKSLQYRAQDVASCMDRSLWNCVRDEKHEFSGVLLACSYLGILKKGEFDLFNNSIWCDDKIQELIEIIKIKIAEID